MSVIKVTNELCVYEFDDREPPMSIAAPKLKIESHWNQSCFVIIHTPDGKRYTVAAKDLHNAVSNAERTGR